MQIDRFNQPEIAVSIISLDNAGFSTSIQIIEIGSCLLRQNYEFTRILSFHVKDWSCIKRVFVVST